MKDLISIIIPCFNQSDYLEYAVHSVIKQTIAEWECIIVNDGSSDDSLIIANQLAASDHRIKVVSQENQGASAARNTGITYSEGEFILPLDADDAISPNYLECCLKIFSHNSEVTLVYGRAETFGKVLGSWDLPSYDYEALLFNNMIHCTALYRKSSWINVGGYDLRMIHGLEDWEFWLSLLNSSSIVVRSEEITFFYRIKDASRQSSMSRDQIERMRREIYLKHYEKYDHLFKDPLSLYYEKKIAQMQFQRLLDRPDWYVKQFIKKIIK